MTIKSHFDDKPRFKVINGWLSEYLFKLSSGKPWSAPCFFCFSDFVCCAAQRNGV